MTCTIVQTKPVSRHTDDAPDIEILIRRKDLPAISVISTNYEPDESHMTGLIDRMINKVRDILIESNNVDQIEPGLFDPDPEDPFRTKTLLLNFPRNAVSTDPVLWGRGMPPV